MAAGRYEYRTAIGDALRDLAARNRGALDSMAMVELVGLRAQEIVGTRGLPDVASVLWRYAELIDPVATAVIACDGGIVRCSCGRCGETLASVPLFAFMRGEMDVPRYCGRCGYRVRVEEE